MSKGSAPRPFSVKDDVFSERYCATFGCKPKNGRCINCGQAKPDGSLNSLEADNGDREPNQ